MLIGFRLILGLSVGIASYTAPLYLAEMADKDSRGQVISGYQFMVTVGDSVGLPVQYLFQLQWFLADDADRHCHSGCRLDPNRLRAA